MNFVSLYFVTCFFWKEILSVSSENNYYHGLIKYLKEESKLHQVVYILNDTEINNRDPLINSLMKEVNTHFPSLSYDNLTIFYKSFRKSLFLQPFRKTTLFVLERRIEKFEEDEFNEFAGRIEELSYQVFQPKILVINTYSSTREVLNNTLSYAWVNYDYLDMTLITFDYKCQKDLKPCSHNSFLLSQFNPFTNKYSEGNVTSESEWFPNKLLNLDKYELYFYFNKQKDPNEEHWEVAIKFANYLSQAMNFNYKVENGLTGNVWEMGLYMDYHVFEKLRNERILKLGRIRAVILNKLKRDKVVVLSPEFVYMLLGTTCTIVIIRFVAIFLGLKKSLWQTLNICQIIMGMPTNQTPMNFKERIIFGSLLISCIVYSGYFYSVILDINWRAEPEIPSLEELANHPLPPMAPSTIKNILVNSTDDHSRNKLANRVLPVPEFGTEIDCLHLLVTYQNISSCLIPDAEYFVNIYTAKMSKLNLRILPETIMPCLSTWKQISNKPYIDRFNEIVLRAAEHGFLNHYYQPVVQLHETIEPDSVETETIFLVLFYVSVIGYSLSIIVFYFEVLIEKLKMKMFRFLN